MVAIVFYSIIIFKLGGSMPTLMGAFPVIFYCSLKVHISVSLLLVLKKNVTCAAVLFLLHGGYGIPCCNLKLSSF